MDEIKEYSEYKRHIIETSTARGDFVAGDDGFYVYWPDGQNHGYLGEHELRVLADHLHELNKEWDKEIIAFFKAQGDV